MSLLPKDDALPTATRLRVLVSLPLAILLVLLLWFLERNDWKLGSSREVASTPRTNELAWPNRRPQPRRVNAGATALTSPSNAAASSVPTVVIEPIADVTDALATAAAPTANTRRTGAASVSSTPLLLSGDVTVVTGRITLAGRPPPETPLPLQSDPLCSRLRSDRPTTRHFLVSSNGGLADVVVSWKDASAQLGNLTVAQREEMRPTYLKLAMSRMLPVIEQRGCEFLPYVSATSAGAQLLVRNLDPVLHTAHTTPVIQGNTATNISLLPKSREVSFVFQQPEEFLRIKCDVHPWMFAYVTVFDHSFFDVTDTNGVFRVPLLPPGRHVLQAVHRKAGRLELEVVVTRGESPVVNFVFELP